MTVPQWIPELTNLNLMAVLDVALDLRDAGQLDRQPTISALPDVVRFASLMPTDGINMRDRYLELRAAALRFLKEKQVINALLPVNDPYTHRWQWRAQVDLDLEVLQPIVTALQAEYASRMKGAENQQQSLVVNVTPVEKLVDLVLRFHGVVMALRTRHRGRPTLDVNDEYDVQDLMSALLATVFDDVRPEEYSPSYGGGGSRTDFLLKKEQIILEIKKTRTGLADKQVGEQLIVDSAKYATHPDCKTLVCMVYDPENRITNERPAGGPEWEQERDCGEGHSRPETLLVGKRLTSICCRRPRCIKRLRRSARPQQKCRSLGCSM